MNDLSAALHSERDHTSVRQEIKFVVGLAGGDPTAVDPTPHAAPVPTPA